MGIFFYDYYGHFMKLMSIIIKEKWKTKKGLLNYLCKSFFFVFLVFFVSEDFNKIKINNDSRREQSSRSPIKCFIKSQVAI